MGYVFLAIFIGGFLAAFTLGLGFAAYSMIVDGYDWLERCIGMCITIVWVGLLGLDGLFVYGCFTQLEEMFGV